MGMMSLLRRRLLLLDLHRLERFLLRVTNLNLFFGELLRRLFLEGDGVTVIGMTISRWQTSCFPFYDFNTECFFLKKVSFGQPFFSFVSYEKMLFL